MFAIKTNVRIANKNRQAQGAKPTDRVSQEEVFGPFVTVTTFRDDEEVLAITNDTDYGLGGGLWTTNLQRAHRTAAAKGRLTPRPLHMVEREPETGG